MAEAPVDIRPSGRETPARPALEVFRSPAAIEREWRSFELTAVGHVFQTYTFVSTWVRTVGTRRGVEPLIVVGRDGVGRPQFILPLGIRQRFGRRQLEWLGSEHADYHCGLFDREYLARPAAAGLPEALAHLLAGGADVCNFQRQPLTLDGLPNPFAAYRAWPHSDSSHETHLESNWNAYYRAKRNSSSRRHDRSKLRRLEELGAVRVNTTPNGTEIDRAMAALFSEKERNLGERGAAGFFECDAVKRFYGDLARTPFPDGPCHVATVECGGDIVAVNWGLVHGRRYYYVMHAFAAQSPAARSSPGRLLMYGLMQWCIERGIDVFDFTIGDEGFKQQWCETSLPLADSISALNPAGAPVALALRAGKMAKRFIKSRPALRSAAEEVRRHLPFARSRPASPVAG
jgi:CelD/BcsL family acetyltransferase involved in cellulose biosynthesis